ncbi:ABC transporter permease [Rhizobium leguminosarum]|uniref:Proline/glycine betaine ABC transporter n=1 Tax=Rhizobium leguminosarum TaxID=384 RepID=A0A2K9ZD18_RHILE|nr:ABC transporter permease [Rhizobium leguminosarum]AUW46129.1 Proline/glycine betaine ABC transporter [Rhizobium leguminosarum]
MIEWFLNPAQWQGSEGILNLLIQHLQYSFISLLIAALIGLPAGLYVGHTGKGTFLIAGLANATRALPSLGLIVLLVILVGPYFKSDLAYLMPSIAVLVLIAVPPIMMGAYSGITSVDPAAVDAARGMGYRPLALLLTVELPCALPLIFSGFRSAALQVISTATIAAYVSLGGLGRLIIDGRAQNDYVQMAAGAVLVGVLALIVDLFFGLASRIAVSPGLTRRTVKGVAIRRQLANEKHRNS